MPIQNLTNPLWCGQVDNWQQMQSRPKVAFPMLKMTTNMRYFNTWTNIVPNLRRLMLWIDQGMLKELFR